MRTLSLQRSHFHRRSLADSQILRVRTTPSLLSPKAVAFPRTTSLSATTRTSQPVETSSRHEEAIDDCCRHAAPNHDGRSRALVLGAVTVGVAAFLLGADDGHHNMALALGPEGPLVEEFWDNVRRYGLYALTVSTGAIYTILQPIIELLKNPISAVLIILILGGSFYIMSQVKRGGKGAREIAIISWVLHSVLGYPTIATGPSSPRSGEMQWTTTGAGPEKGTGSCHGDFRMPLHYPRYSKSDYEKMEEWKVDMLLKEYGLSFTGSVAEKREFAMGTFLWPDQY